VPAPRIPLPADVIEYVRKVFVAADDSLAARMERQPSVHEEMLDLAFIDAVATNCGPHKTVSDTVVDIDIHFVGGGWHYDRWEVADVGLIVTFRRLGEVLRTKVLLLQSKRLYPREAEFVEGHGLARPGGFGYLARPGLSDVRQQRLFRFDHECRYRALQIGDNQWSVIADYESRYGIPVHYLLYHPGTLPYQVTVPVQLPLPPRPPTQVGSRVLPATLMRARTTQFPRNYAPSVADLAEGRDSPGASLPDFMADEVLACNEGYIPDNFELDAGINRIFNQRTGPIAAAILVDIDLPADVEQQEPLAPQPRP
jgi:hypothetical protein